MTRIALSFALATAALAFSLPAHAASLTRTFVSSAGLDTNPCTITAPCRTFAVAYANTAANGIIAALDPGRYGSLTITGAITINGNGWASITAPAAGNGITINAGASDNVALIGLEIDGAQAAYNGIVLNSAGSLTVTNCTLQNFFYENTALVFTGDGILLQPTTGTTLDFTITDTTAANNGYAGIYFSSSGSSTVTGVIDHVVADANEEGIIISLGLASGGSAFVTISNSTTSDNIGDGILALSTAGTLKVSIDNVSASANNNGISAVSPANVLLGRSVITGNRLTGVNNQTSPSTVYTYKDNRINLNGTDIAGAALNTSLATQ